MFVLLTSVFLIAKFRTTKIWEPQLVEKQLLACPYTWRHCLLHKQMPWFVWPPLSSVYTCAKCPQHNRT